MIIKRKKRAYTLILALLMATMASATVAAPEEPLPLTADLFEGPILLTSVGQSADVNIVNTLFGKIKVEVRLAAAIKAEELEGYKTLVLAVGGSAKGLGAAGIDEHQELARVTTLIAKAKELDIKILAVHIGGVARRGVLSDMFIPDAFAAANAAIVVQAGDEDQVMRKILLENKIPAAYVANQVGALEPMTLLFVK